MKNLWKKGIFIDQFHFQDPDSEYGLRSSLAILIRIQPDHPKHYAKINLSKCIYANERFRRARNRKNGNGTFSWSKSARNEKYLSATMKDALS